MKHLVRSGLIVIMALTLVRCEPGGIGDPCLPDEEYHTQFSGFAVTEVNVESRSLQCATRVCLVNHFQGRVSCPYGQSKDELNQSDPRCRIPGAGGEDDAALVTVPVEAWDTDRPPERAVYCSCRCDGPDPNARYCDCPTGFRCQPLLPDLGLANVQLSGSYCVRQGTVFSQRELGGDTCRTNPSHPACAQTVQ